MRLSDYHTKFLANELTKRCATDSIEKLAGALVDAQVDLNPHQVDAALFAFKSPFSKGALLADEVGLGKTIEAGLVISQRWAEQRRRILIITPANLRKQWHQELQEKFFLPSVIFEAKSYNTAVKQGASRLFEDQEKIVICSYHFARNKAEEVQNIPWDLVVIDEAHRLRAIGHMFEAEDESQVWPELHAAIREARKSYQAVGTQPDWESLGESVSLAGNASDSSFSVASS